MKRTRFSGREHLVIGARLSRMRDEVMALHLAMSDAYGKTAAAPVRAVERQLTTLKSALDSIVCREHPMSVRDIEGVPIVRIYYGWPNGPAHEPTCRTTESARAELRQAAETITDGNPWAEAKREAPNASRELSLAVAQLKASVQLRTLIAETLPLKRAGRDWVACCPFHAEKTSSFHAYPDHFHCSGCNAHGDAFDWLGRTRGMRLAEAVHYLRGSASHPSGDAA